MLVLDCVLCTIIHSATFERVEYFAGSVVQTAAGANGCDDDISLVIVLLEELLNVAPVRGGVAGEESPYEDDGCVVVRCHL